MTNFDISHFNPGSQKESDFLANFIARQDVLKFFLAQLRNIKDQQSAKHHIIIAPRGYGKTSLLRRLKLAIRDEDEFKTRYIPLSFREEQHNVISLDVFWRNCLESLLEAREDEAASPAEIKTLDQLWLKHAPRSNLKRNEQDGEPAYTAFAEYCRQLGRRPVLLIDNLDALLAGLVEQHQWKLRAVLQKTDGPVLIAAAPQYPDSLIDSKVAFFDFFRITNLKPLGDHEVMACLSKLAKMRGEKGIPVRKMLESDPGRISALNTMAGGNPRTLGVLYTVLEAHMSDDVLAQLSAMLDTFTGWYQARTEELPLQSRAVFDALALNWDPMTAADIKKITGLDTPTVSSHLSRLEKSGYAETVSLSKKKKSRNGYQVSERFYNIWYLMRNGPRRTRQAIKFLTIFLRSCFSRKELHVMAKDKLQNGVGRVESTLALAACIGDSRLRGRLLNTAENSLDQLEQADETRMLLNEMRNEIKPKAEQYPAKNKKQIEKLFKKAEQHVTDHEIDLAETVYRQIIALDESSAFPWAALGNLIHHESDRYDEAEVAYRKAISLDDKWVIPWGSLGDLLQYELGRYDEAETAYRKTISLDENRAHPWGALGDLLQDHLGRYEEAEAAYRKSIALNEKWDNPWGRLGDLLCRHLDRNEEAEIAYRKAIALNEKSSEAWSVLGNLLRHKLHRYEEAEAAYLKSITLDENVAYPWGRLGALLHYELERYDEAETAYRKAISLDEKWGPAWGMLGDLLQDHFGRYKEAESAYRQAISLDEQWVNPLNALGCLLQDHLGHYEEAEAIYRQSIVLDEKNSYQWIKLGNLLQDYLGRYEDALDAYKAGLDIDPQDSCLCTNIVYLLVLHIEQQSEINDYVKQALSGLLPSGKHLLNSLLAWSSDDVDAASRGWSELHQAISCGDEALWSEYIDDLQRVLAYVIVKGDGEFVRTWMINANYSVEFAPLYHAFCATLDGEDHLLRVNPEVRASSEKIYTGLARMVDLFKKSKK